MVINNCILLEARRLLLFSNKPVKEITKKIGFQCENHFSSFLNSKNGVSPNRFKKGFETTSIGSIGKNL